MAVHVKLYIIVVMEESLVSKKQKVKGKGKFNVNSVAVSRCLEWFYF